MEPTLTLRDVGKLDAPSGAPVVLAILLACVATASPQDGSAQTAEEGVAQDSFRLHVAEGIVLQGQIDFPQAHPRPARTPLPAVVFVGGTGFFDRDYLYGTSGTEEDLLFRELSRDLTEAGLAVVRFDFRGVSCNERTMPECPGCRSGPERIAHFVEHCVDNDVRGTITWESLRRDIEHVYRHAERHPEIDADRIVVLGHSEGSIHVSSLAGGGRIDPIGLVFIGMAAEAPADLIRWQWESRARDQFLAQAEALVEAAGDGAADRLTEAEVRAYCESMELDDAECEALLPPQGSWTSSALADSLTRRGFDEMKRLSLAASPEEPFAHLHAEHGAVYASYAWWQTFLSTEELVVDLLAHYPGQVSIHFGEIDAATPPKRQLPVIRASPVADRAEVRVHPQLGHALGRNEMLGPISRQARDVLRAAVLRMVR